MIQEVRENSQAWQRTVYTGAIFQRTLIAYLSGRTAAMPANRFRRSKILAPPGGGICGNECVVDIAEQVVAGLDEHAQAGCKARRMSNMFERRTR